MNNRLLKVLTALAMLLLPKINYGQAPPLGTAANFVLFTSVGAVTNSSGSMLTGNVGTNVGSSTGFGNVNGVMENNNAATAQCGTDLLVAYNDLDTTTPTAFPSSLLGNGDTLLPGVYHIASAATLSLHLILNALGNPNAVFIFQVQGPLSVGAAAKVILINGGLACNVFWKVEGLVSVSAGATMRGTIIANNAAITMGTTDTLEGRALSTSGAVSVGGLMAYTPVGCGSVLLTGPAAPDLVSTANYGIFSSNGYVTNSGITYVVGDVGSNLGLTTGFNPLLVTGMIHPVPDASTATCASDLTTVYNYLETLPYDIELLYPATFGSGLILTPHTYLMNSATTFTGTVYLDAQGNSNAVFVIRINGAMLSSTFSNVKLINGTLAKNVYWLVNGAVNINNNSNFNGTLIANNGAITFNPGDSLTGRAMSTDGAVSIDGIYANINGPAGSGGITGPSTVCIGSAIVLSDTTHGGIWRGSNLHALVTDSLITGLTTGIDTISYTVITLTDTTVATKIITVSVPPSAGIISGPASMCVGATVTFIDTTSSGVWSSSNATATNTGAMFTGVNNGIDTVMYIVATGCGSDTAQKPVIIDASSAGAITGPSAVCIGSSVLMTDSIPGGIWTATNTRAAVVAGVVTGASAGIDTILYTVTNICGTYIASKAITVGVPANAGTVTGPSSVCVGSSISLADTAPGGYWSSSNAHATVNTGGNTTGVSQGIDTIYYNVSAACGITSAAKTVTVNAIPGAGVITGLSNVCVGDSILLFDVTPGGVWSAANADASVNNGAVTGVTAGIDTIIYTVSGVCGNGRATKTVVVNPSTDPGTISGPSSVCVNATITLTDPATDGVWTASNLNATVDGGDVTGVSGGMDTISYTVSGICGIASATKVITVDPLAVTGTISAPSVVCMGSSVTFTGAVSGGIWSTSNNLATVSNGVVTGVTAGIDTIIYTASNSCNTASVSIAIVIDALPALPMITTQSAASVCSGIMYQNFGAATMPPASVSYTWSETNATIWAQGTANQYILVNFENSGAASVTLTADNTGTGCSISNTVDVAVGTGVSSTPQVIYSEGNLICLQDDVVSYQWGYDDYLSLDSSLLVGEINQNYSVAVLDTTKFYWVITNYASCMQKTYYIAPTAGSHRTGAPYAPTIQYGAAGTQVSIFPNPATDEINVAITTTVPGVIHVEVTNLLGQLITAADAVNNNAKINVAGFPAGTYLIGCYRDGVKISASRFVKN